MHKSHEKDTKKKNSAQNTHVFKDNLYCAQDGICMVPHGGYTAKAVNTAKAVQTAQMAQVSQAAQNVEKSQYAAIEIPISGISTVTCYLPNSFVSAQMSEELTLDDIVLMSATSGCSANAYDFGMSGASLYVPHSSANISSAISAVYTSSMPISHGGLMYQFASSCRHAGGKYIAAGLLTMNLVQGMVLPHMAYAFTSEVGTGKTSVTVTSETVDQNRQTIYDGGTAIDTTIISSGEQYISSGGSASGTIISNGGGGQHIFSSGMATDTTISAGAKQFISNGGTVSGTILAGIDAQQYVYSGGTAIDTTIVSAGARQEVASGGIAIGTNISTANQHVSSGGTAIDTNITGGVQFVYNGAIISNTTVSAGGVQVFDGATATSHVTNNILLSGAIQTFVNGAVASGSVGGTVGNGIIQEINGGGSAVDVQVLSGGVQSLLTGGVAYDTIVSNGGVQAIGGQNTPFDNVAYNTIVLSGGSQLVGVVGASGENVASGTILSSGARQILQYGGIVRDSTNTVTYSRGTTLEVSFDGGVIDGNVVFDGGTFVPNLDPLKPTVPILQVNGTATGLSTATIAPQWILYQNPSSGEVTYTVMSASSIDSIFGTEAELTALVGATQELAKFAYRQEVLGNELLLHVKEKKAIFNEISSALSPNGKRLVPVLDTILDGDYNLDELTTAIGSLPDDPQLLAAVADQLFPAHIATMQHVNTTFFRNIMLQLPSFNNGFSQILLADPITKSLPAGSEMGLNAGASNTQKSWSVFGSPFGMTASQGDYEGISGYDISLAGVNVGAMRFFNDAWFGFSTAYAHHELDMKLQNSSVSGDQLAFMLFGGIKFDSNFLLEGALGYSHTWNDSEREVNVGTYTDNLTADFSQNNFMASLKFGYLWALDNGLRIIPSIGLDYVYSYTSGFEESGGNAALGLESNSVHSLQIPVHLRLEKTFNINDILIVPQLTIGYIPELADTYAISTAYFTNAATAGTFQTQSVENSRHTFMAGAGIEMKLNNDVSLAVDYELNVRDGFNSHSVNLVFDWKF